MIPRLEIRHLSKTFGSMRVLSDVDLTIAPGEIHGLVGQNGSGKSTLIKIVAGYHSPDRGAELRVDGRQLRLPMQSEELRAAGIAVVHQDLGLVDHLSVADNIGVGQYHRTHFTWRVDRRSEAAAARAALGRLDCEIDPASVVSSLAATDRFRVAIARALRSQRDGEGLVILDESTRALSRDALAAFYSVLRGAVRLGSSVLVVAHSLPEVMAFTDRVTVLRDGKVSGAGLPTPELSEQHIARLMLGRDVHQVGRPPVPRNRAAADPVVVSGLDLGHGKQDISIARGEIVGIAGRPGSGVDDLPYLLTGARQARCGTLTVGSATIDLSRTDPRELLLAGVVLVPERRHVLGLAVGLKMSENITLPRISRRGRWHFSGIGWQRREASSVIESLEVRPANPAMIVGKLSGGNQQKVLLGKWLAGAPHFIVLHEPTQGVDVSARQDILAALIEAAAKGCSILVASSDPGDLAAVCHRVLILRDGTVASEIVEPDADTIVEAVYATGLQDISRGPGG